MTDNERELDLMVAELETENRLMRARNERLEKELAQARADLYRFQTEVERVLTVSKLALWDGPPRRVREVGTQARESHKECND